MRRYQTSFNILTCRRRLATSGEWVSDETRRARTRWDMVDDVALRKLSAHSRARILALVSYTGAISGAVGAQNTFGSAAFVRISLVIGDAAAGAGPVALSALRVGSARRRLAGIGRFLLLQYALNERISCVSGGAGASDGMADDSAFGVGATGPGTRIAAFLVDAGLRSRAVRINDTFGAARRRRSDVVWQTRAARRRTLGDALRVRPARRWIARIHSYGWNYRRS